MAETDDIARLKNDIVRLKNLATHPATKAWVKSVTKDALTKQAAEIERLTQERDEEAETAAANGRFLCARATTAERERDEARAEVERKDAALLRIAKRCRRPDLVARAALEEEGKT